MTGGGWRRRIRACKRQCADAIRGRVDGAKPKKNSIASQQRATARVPAPHGTLVRHDTARTRPSTTTLPSLLHACLPPYLFSFHPPSISLSLPVFIRHLRHSIVKPHTPSSRLSPFALSFVLLASFHNPTTPPRSFFLPPSNPPAPTPLPPYPSLVFPSPQ